jgi:hypothetical protein
MNEIKEKEYEYKQTDHYESNIDFKQYFYSCILLMLCEVIDKRITTESRSTLILNGLSFQHL